MSAEIFFFGGGGGRVGRGGLGVGGNGWREEGRHDC